MEPGHEWRFMGSAARGEGCEVDKLAGGAHQQWTQFWVLVGTSVVLTWSSAKE